MRTVIVDDEEFARRDLRRLLKKHPEIEIIGEAEDITQAINVISEMRPQVVFLDIQLSGESGFELFEYSKEKFKVIFVTAFDNFAVRAFEVNALDYLLKPVSPERLASTISRLFDNKESGQTQKPTEKKLVYDDFIFFKSKTKNGFIKVNQIVLVTATGNYTDIITVKSNTEVVLKPLIEWEKQLPGQHFIRIHRNIIVNINYIEKIHSWFKGTYQIYLHGLKEPVITSRRYATKIREYLI
jgi:two-component system LytT family response regulator